MLVTRDARHGWLPSACPSSRSPSSTRRRFPEADVHVATWFPTVAPSRARAPRREGLPLLPGLRGAASAHAPPPGRDRRGLPPAGPEAPRVGPPRSRSSRRVTPGPTTCSRRRSPPPPSRRPTPARGPGRPPAVGVVGPFEAPLKGDRRRAPRPSHGCARPGATCACIGRARCPRRGEERASPRRGRLRARAPVGRDAGLVPRLDVLLHPSFDAEGFRSRRSRRWRPAFPSSSGHPVASGRAAARRRVAGSRGRRRLGHGARGGAACSTIRGLGARAGPRAGGRRTFHARSRPRPLERNLRGGSEDSRGRRTGSRSPGRRARRRRRRPAGRSASTRVVSEAARRDAQLARAARVERAAAGRRADLERARGPAVRRVRRPREEVGRAAGRARPRPGGPRGAPGRPRCAPPRTRGSGRAGRRSWTARRGAGAVAVAASSERGGRAARSASPRARAAPRRARSCAAPERLAAHDASEEAARAPRRAGEGRASGPPHS